MRKIGIIGGGQLGRMAIEEARKYLAHIEVLTPDYPSPGAEIADAAHVGPLDDFESVLEFAREVDVVSFEIEHVNIDALRELERGGKPVLPSAGTLAAINDKARQKALLDAAGIPTARWRELPSAPGRSPAPEALAQAAAALGGFPLVQKARFGGYDGRGVAVLASAADEALPGPSFAEEKVDFAKELAVVVARSPDGSTACYPCVEMAFDPRANLCDSVLAPARDLEEASVAAGSPPGGAAGVFGIEMFLLRDGGGGGSVEILVNEIAPRPHNSGHYTIEACASSQFDQYIRILLGLPLGSAELLRPAAMLNLLGEPGASGEPDYRGLEEALALPGVALHLYGKSGVRPFRKMGHLTAIGGTADEAMERAAIARDRIKILSRRA